MRYNVGSDQAARIAFDEMCSRVVEDALSSLDEQEILDLDIEDYALILWEDDQSDVDDLEEAQARWVNVGMGVIANRQREIRAKYGPWDDGPIWRRVANSEALQPYRDTILHEWDDPGHWDWVATASEEEIISWAQSVEADEDGY
jgi:hypothetical protein